MYFSYLVLYQSADYVVCMIKKNVYTESTNTFISSFAILFKMSKLIHLPLNLVRTDHEILFLHSKLFLMLSLI